MSPDFEFRSISEIIEGFRQAMKFFSLAVFLKPRVFNDLLNGQAFLRIRVEETNDQVLELSRTSVSTMCPEEVVLLGSKEVAVERIRQVWSLERQSPCDHHEQANTERERVRSSRIVQVTVLDLRSYVTFCALNSSRMKFVLSCSKVDELGVHCLFNYDVF